MDLETLDTPTDTFGAELGKAVVITLATSAASVVVPLVVLWAIGRRAENADKRAAKKAAKQQKTNN